MTKLLAVVVVLSGCAAPHSRNAPSTIPVAVRSHNRSEVDVYLLCGERNAQRLGLVQEEEAREFEVPAGRERCAAGINFLLVQRSQNRSYWVGPLHLKPGARILLVIEKYAGLSTAAVSY